MLLLIMFLIDHQAFCTHVKILVQDEQYNFLQSFPIKSFLQLTKINLYQTHTVYDTRY